MRMQFPITEKTYHRWTKHFNADMDLVHPFIFTDTISEKYDYVFVLNHGTESGYLWNGELQTTQTVSEFVNYLYETRPSLKQWKQIVLLCCHGGLIHNDMENTVVIANETVNELHAWPPVMCCTLGDELCEFTFTVEAED